MNRVRPAPGDAPPAIPLWLSLASHLPMPVLYGIAGLLAWFARVALRLRLRVIRENLGACFPELGADAIERLVIEHFRGVGETVAELVVAARLPAAELADRVRIRNLDLARSLLDEGSPVLLLGAHQANWEWVLQAIALQLGYPLDVAYKPIRSVWLDRLMRAVRSRSGAHLVPARDELVMDVMRRRHVPRGIAMLADQSPVSADQMTWLPFLGRDTAFYLGPEKLARATQYPVLFVALRRITRGRYEVTFRPLADRGERLASGVLTARYAAMVEAGIRAAPADWTWGHRRWKARRNLYTRPGDA